MRSEIEYDLIGKGLQAMVDLSAPGKETAMGGVVSFAWMGRGDASLCQSAIEVGH